MTPIYLLKLAHYFERLAQDLYDPNLRNRLINIRPDDKNFSFREVANVVLQDLTSLDREEKDTAITGASHALLDILNSLSVPNASAMLNAATSAANAIRQKVPTDAKKNQVANYLVGLVKLLTNKYLSPSHKPSQEAEETTPDQSVEGSVPFLQRLYGHLRQNQPVSDDDRTKWQNSKSIYIRRINALNSMPNRTPAQEQERLVIRFVTGKL